MKLSLPILSLAACMAAFTLQPAKAQQGPVHRCGTDEHAAALERANPSLARQRAQLDAQIQQAQANPTLRRNSPMRRIIPTVVHVVHNYAGENVSKADILATLNQLNLDFARRNSDTLAPRSIYASRATDMDMEFRLVTKDPNGNPTDGITRISSPYTVLPGDHDNGWDSVKTVRNWSTDKYFNIWIVKTIGAMSGGTVLGYAQFPYPTGNQTWGTWGVVLQADAARSRTDRTLTHEVGHCFNLYHTFQGGCNGNCATAGDMVCDTPPAAANTFTCNVNQNTCGNAASELDMIENYMSYDNCQNMFTQGQRARVDAAVAAVSQLQNLFSPANLIATGVDSASLVTATTGPPVADFGASETNICRGNAVNLIDASYNGTEDASWSWTYKIGGGDGRTFSGKNVNVQFDSAGYWPVTLVVRNSAGVDSVTKTMFVVRPSTGRIAVVPQPPAPDYVASYRYSFEAPTLDEQADPFRNFYQSGGLWSITNQAHADGSQSIFIRNSGSAATGFRSGRKSYLYTPSFDISAMPSSNVPGQPNTYLYFRRALARRTSGNFSDSLSIQQSLNCAANWQTRLIRAQNTPVPIVTSPNTISGLNWFPLESDWVLDSLNLASIQGANRRNVQFRFRMASYNAQALYLDDIQIGTRYQRVTGLKGQISQGAVSLEILPHPATSQTQLEVTSPSGSINLNLTDATGRVLATRSLQGSGTHVVALRELAPGLAPGVYLVRVESAAGRLVRRMVVAE